MTNRLAVRDMGTALLFDGVDDYVSVPDANTPTFVFTSGFTVSAWINPLTAGEAVGGRIMDKANTSASGSGGFAWLVTSANTVAMVVNGGTVRSAATNSVKYARDWIHVVTTVAADATVTHYINGVLSGTPGTTGALSGITTTSDLYIGNSTATDRSFHGMIDEPRLWAAKVLNAEEALNLYLYNAVPYRESLSFEFLLNEGSGFVATDSGIWAADGTISGATYVTNPPVKTRTVAQ